MIGLIAVVFGVYAVYKLPATIKDALNPEDTRESSNAFATLCLMSLVGIVILAILTGKAN